MAALLVTVVVVSGCGSGDETDDVAAPTTTEVSAFEQDRRAGVETLFADWVTALRADDHEALRELIDPAAAPEFVDAQLARADAMSTVDFDSFEYVLVDSPETPVPQRIAAGLTVTDLWAPQVQLHYAIAGSDTQPASLPVSLVVTRHGDRWSLLSDAALDEFGRRTHPGPWDFGPVVVSRAESPAGDSAVSTVLGHADKQSEIDALTAQLGTAVPAVSELWGTDWSQRAVIFVTSTDAEFDGIISGGRGTSDATLAAVTLGDPTELGDQPKGQRIVFGPQASEQFTDRGRETVVRHELTHVALRSATAEGAALWLLEGWADYTAYRNRGFDFAEITPTLSRVVRDNGAPTVLPADDAFAAGGAAAALAYESAWSIAAYVAQRYSEGDLVEMYRRLAAAPLDPVTLDDTLDDLFGTTARGFVADWGTWVADQVRAEG